MQTGETNWLGGTAVASYDKKQKLDHVTKCDT